MKLEDKTQIFRPLQIALNNRWSYYKYVWKHVGLWGWINTIILVVSLVGFGMSVIDFWLNDKLLVRIICAILFGISLVYKLFDFSVHYTERFTKVDKIKDIYKDIMPPSNKWTRLDIKIDNDLEAIYVNKEINQWLADANAISLYRDRYYEKKLHKYISDTERWRKVFRPFISNKYKEAIYTGEQFYNEAKAGISTEFSVGDKEISFHKTSYYDSYLTNIIPGKRLVFRKDESDLVDTRNILMPYQEYEINNIKVLELVGAKLRANEPGVTTLCFTVSGYIFLWQQTLMTQSSKSLIVPSGSGSLDWKDCKGLFKDPDGFRKAIKRGMNRELWEESCGSRSITKKDFIKKVDTKILGYFRWLNKAGKPEFVGISRLRDLKMEEFLVPEIFEVKKGCYINARNMKTLRKEINERINYNKTKERYKAGKHSVVCVAALLMLEIECEKCCEHCPQRCDESQEIECTLKPYDVLFKEYPCTDVSK